MVKALATVTVLLHEHDEWTLHSAFVDSTLFAPSIPASFAFYEKAFVCSFMYDSFVKL